MSLHKQPELNTPEIHAALARHKMATDTPSQLSDAFRLGWQARAQARKKPAVGVWPWAAGVAVVGLFLAVLGASLQ